MKELGINDVRVGNWVDVRYDGVSETPHIEKLTPASFLRNEHWFGIELTTEVLEKIGFKKDVNERGAYIITVDNLLAGDGFETQIVKIFCRDGCMSLNIETAVSRLFLPIKFVHELQNSLQVCNINLEISL